MERDRIFLFGINPVLEKLKASPDEVTEVIIAADRHGPLVRAIDAEARRLGLSVTYLPSRDLDRLIERRKHQGVLAKVEPYSYLAFDNLLRELSSNPGREWILVLDGLTDPRNFGALLRSAEATGIRYVIIPRDRSVSVTSIVIKASAGAAHHLKVCRVINLRRAIMTLKERGFWIAGLDVRARETIYDRVYPEKLAIVLGSEGAGMRPVIRQECDYLVSVPMRGRIGSLNVAVAGAVFLYELLRQHICVDTQRG